jgi:cell division protein FtsB
MVNKHDDMLIDILTENVKNNETKIKRAETKIENLQKKNEFLKRQIEIIQEDGVE